MTSSKLPIVGKQYRNKELRERSIIFEVIALTSDGVCCIDSEDRNFEDAYHFSDKNWFDRMEEVLND